MCFSAEASFVGGAVLTAIGIMTVRKNCEPAQRLFSTMPLVFGLQQISEGFVWIALKTPGQDLYLKIAAYVFLTAALLIWPTFVPLSVRLMETDPLRRRMLNALTGLGLLTSLSYLTGMILFDMTVRISSLHVSYSADAPQTLLRIAYLSYLAVTLLPFFISSVRRVYLLGAVVIISYAVAAYFYSEYLLSVWCFFAAVASVVVWWIVGACNPATQQQAQQGA